MLNYTEPYGLAMIINFSEATLTQSPARDGFHDGKDLSFAVRVLNGIIIFLLFTIGLCTNVTVLHVLRRRKILLKNTSVILANVMITDLICVLIVLPHDFIFYAADVTLPRLRVTQMSKISLAIKNVMIFLNCGFTITLNIERTKTATYLGKRRGDDLSRPLVFCLATVWMASLGEAFITYRTVNDSNMLPRKRYLLGQTNASRRSQSAGIVVVIVLVLITALAILASLYRIKRFLHGFNVNTQQNLQSFSRRKIRCKMHKRITAACLASLATLVVSYVPVIAATLTWHSMGRHSCDANAIVHVLCSIPHVINPLVAIAMSDRVQRAFMSVLKSVYPLKFLLKSYVSSPKRLEDKNAYFYYFGAKERIRFLEKNLHEQCHGREVVSGCSNEGTESAVDDVFQPNSHISVNGKRNEWVPLKQLLTGVKKKPLAEQHSIPVGIPLYVKKKPLAARHSAPVGIRGESTIDDIFQPNIHVSVHPDGNRTEQVLKKPLTILKKKPLAAQHSAPVGIREESNIDDVFRPNIHVSVHSNRIEQALKK